MAANRESALPLFRCPVEGCDYWVALGGYTERAIRSMKRHVQSGHSLLPAQSRFDGGLVDAFLADAIALAAKCESEAA